MGKKFSRKKRGVSPVIAVLMLIAIAVATGILVYVWVSGLAGSLTQSGGTQVAEQLTLEAYNYTTPSSGVTLYIRNTGSVNVELESTSIYFDGVQGTTTSATITTSTTLAPTETTKIVITLDEAKGATAGSSHLIKVVTKTGAVFEWTVIAGRSG